ncbi:hypothetical protein CsSME_00022698 [Camellia sinensis var. sinensis]
MVSLVPVLSSTISRLNFLPRPFFYHSLRALSLTTLQFNFKDTRPTLSPSNSSSSILSMSNLSSPKPENENPETVSDNLVILDIEASCDDTVASVVSHTQTNPVYIYIHFINGEILSHAGILLDMYYYYYFFF